MERLSHEPVLVFAATLGLFGCYVLQIHRLCNHHQTARALRLMFSHYFIVIAVNLVTVVFKFLDNAEASSVFAAGLMAGALVLFFVPLYSDGIYYHAGIGFTERDALASAFSLAAGTLVMLAGSGSAMTFALGALIAAYGNLVLLIRKAHMPGFQPDEAGIQRGED